MKSVHFSHINSSNVQEGFFCFFFFEKTSLGYILETLLCCQTGLLIT